MDTVGRWMSLVIPSISSVMMEVLAMNCGHTIHPTNQRGSSMTFIPVQTIVDLAIIGSRKYLLVIIWSSQPMMDQLVRNCGRITHPPSTTRRTRVVTSPPGPSTPVCQAVSPSVRTTVRSTVRRPNSGHKRPTWFGPTTVVDQAWPTSTSPWLTKSQPSPIHRAHWC